MLNPLVPGFGLEKLHPFCAPSWRCAVLTLSSLACPVASCEAQNEERRMIGMGAEAVELVSVVASVIGSMC